MDDVIKPSPELAGDAAANQMLPHNGGPRPLPHGIWIEVKFRGEADPAKGVLRTHGPSHIFAWHHDGAEDDIIAYRLAEHKDQNDG